MLSITSSQPAVWSPPSPVAAPVSAASAVAPVQPASRDAQTGSGTSGREPSTPAPTVRSGAASAERADKAPATDAAPLLPREASDAQDTQGAVPGAETQAEGEVDEQTRQAEEKALKQQLQDVISNIWKASAAVVDVALGRDAASAEGADPSAVSASAGAVVSAPAPISAPVPTGRTEAANDAVAGLVELRATQEVVAYDAQGHGSVAPLEAGTLVNRRV